MNQENIGKFIAELRKEKNMTQQELADKLMITDRAISHWENGRRLPDISLLKSLSEIFEVSITEILNGNINRFFTTLLTLFLSITFVFYHHFFLLNLYLY